MTKRSRWSVDTPAVSIMNALTRGLGKQWSVTLHKVNSADFGLPQSRRRIYFVGRRSVLYPQGTPSGLPFFRSMMNVSEVIAPNGILEAQPMKEYTPLVEQNIADWKYAMRSLLNNASQCGQCVIFPPDRTPTGRTRWGAALPRPGLFPCLTATGPMLHVCSLGEGSGADMVIDRPIHKFERGAAQGFPRSICSLPMPDNVAKRIFGNAMSLPVVGSVLANELCCLMRARSLQTCARPASNVLSQSTVDDSQSETQLMCFLAAAPANIAQQVSEPAVMAGGDETDDIPLGQPNPPTPTAVGDHGISSPVGHCSSGGLPASCEGPPVIDSDAAHSESGLCGPMGAACPQSQLGPVSTVASADIATGPSPPAASVVEAAASPRSVPPPPPPPLGPDSDSDGEIIAVARPGAFSQASLGSVGLSMPSGVSDLVLGVPSPTQRSAGAWTQATAAVSQPKDLERAVVSSTDSESESSDSSSSVAAASVEAKPDASDSKKVMIAHEDSDSESYGIICSTPDVIGRQCRGAP